jgi:hypothetical protein
VNQKKLDPYDEKTFHWNSENILYLVGRRGQLNPPKKNCECWSISTVRHPLGLMSLVKHSGILAPDPGISGFAFTNVPT